MALGWWTVLKMVPWGDVIENAPKVAQGAKKLWNSVGKKKGPGPDVVAVAPDLVATTAASPEVLQAQLQQLQQAVTDLQQQMQQSSALIDALAEQNAQLVARVELNRKRLLALAVLLLGLLALVWFR